MQSAIEHVLKTSSKLVNRKHSTMKISTANVKNPAYVENHEIFVGTHTGSIKRIGLVDENPHKQTNLEDIQSLSKSSRVTTLNFGDSEDEILLGRVEPVVKVYDVPSKSFTGKHTFAQGPIIGLAKFNGKIIAGLGNGKIQIGHEEPTFLGAGDGMNRLRQCVVDRKLIASGGKERQNNLKVWNLETNECIFKTKNVPNDFLQLEVPIWDSDFGFIDANCLSTCSRHGYVRVYDMRKQRRPVFNYTNEKEQIGYSCLALHGNEVFAGTTTGIMHAFDLRKMKHVLHTYKGFTGSISDIGVDPSGKFVYSASLDRFIRVHHAESTALQYQCYVKSKATRILLRKYTPVKVKQEEEKEMKETKSVNRSTHDSDNDDFDEMFKNMQTVVDGQEQKKEAKQKKRKSTGLINPFNKLLKKKKKKESSL